ncbi:MAG TPA: NAD(P)-dependent oxidoreductase [Nitrososphaera sp.]|jgi:nucleoside-diphosphate-sugar epimerase|nr:NAD(P)-dependent oxidoreductase [Nitrososphaera sp.]
MKALVTGSEGFIGKHLVAMLLEDGHEVEGLDIKFGDDVVECHLPDEFDRVFHLAAQTDARSTDAVLDARNNVVAAVRVMQRYGSKVTFSSSSAVNYPTTPYAVSKKACEDYAKLFGCGVVRFCNVYGPGGRSFIDRYKSEAVVNANKPGTQIRTYASVYDACEALLRCKPGELNILCGEDLTVQQIIDDYYWDKKIVWHEHNKYDVIEGRQVYGL